MIPFSNEDENKSFKEASIGHNKSYFSAYTKNKFIL